MADLIRIKGGSGSVPTLQERELGYSKTEKSLYIGTANGNIKLCSASDIEKIAEIVGRIDDIEARVEYLENN